MYLLGQLLEDLPMMVLFRTRAIMNLFLLVFWLTSKNKGSFVVLFNDRLWILTIVLI